MPATATMPTTTPTPAGITLPAEKKPKYWFFETVDDRTKAYPRLRLLAGQFVPSTDVPDVYYPANVKWNTKAEHDIRNHFPLGTIFVAPRIEIYRNCYNVPGSPGSQIFPIVKEGKGYTIADAQMRTHYMAFMSGEPVPGTAPAPKPVPAPTPVSPAGSFLEGLKKNATYNPPKAEDGFYMEAHTWYFLVRNVLQGENTLLTGPTGCGKTAGVGLLAERLGLPLSIFDMGAMHDPITGLLGANRLENGKTFFDYSRFSQVIQQPGIVLLDELSRPAASCNNIIFPLTDDRRELPVEIAASAGVRNIPVHPGCVFIATANVGNEYTGTTKIDRGLLDRFTPLELDYMPQDTEEKMLVKRAGILPSPARIIAKVAATTRRKAAAGELSTAISHRHTLKAAKLVADGFSVISALEMIALPLFESGPDGERAEVKTMIASN